MTETKEKKRDRVSPRTAYEEGRCACDGCPSCTGEKDRFACGLATGKADQSMCSFCRRDRA